MANALVLSSVIDNGGFLTNVDVEALVKDMPDALVLLRSGMNRYTCRMDQINETIEQIEANNDYLRDVSFPAPNYDNIKNGLPYIAAKKIVAKY